MYEIRDHSGTSLCEIPVDRLLTELTVSLSGDKDDANYLDISLINPKGKFPMLYKLLFWISKIIGKVRFFLHRNNSTVIIISQIKYDNYLNFKSKNNNLIATLKDYKKINKKRLKG